MSQAFAIAGGTVAGRHHVHAGRNNQDAFAWRTGPNGLVAVVCDGCSSGSASEVGARLGAALVCQAVLAGLGPEDPIASLERAQASVLSDLSRLAERMSGEPQGGPAYRSIVAEHFLFTVVGVALQERRAWAFTLGDGLLAVNGAVERLGPFPGNAPPYLGYRLLGDAGPGTGSLDLRPLPAPEALESVVLGTDGAVGLELTEVRTDPRVLANPDMVRRLLWMQGKRTPLEDDATVVVVRRAGEAP